MAEENKTPDLQAKVKELESKLAAEEKTKIAAKKALEKAQSEKATAEAERVAAEKTAIEKAAELATLEEVATAQNSKIKALETESKTTAKNGALSKVLQNGDVVTVKMRKVILGGVEKELITNIDSVPTIHEGNLLEYLEVCPNGGSFVSIVTAE